ncbi:hypothetical protein M0802_003304 [Mischocyttarus mexicanus]|nr:hypothetical protein M0802_003304 [Mischocyttarus mexicanus]
MHLASLQNTRLQRGTNGGDGSGGGGGCGSFAESLLVRHCATSQTHREGEFQPLVEFDCSGRVLPAEEYTMSNGVARSDAAAMWACACARENFSIPFNETNVISAFYVCGMVWCGMIWYGMYESRVKIYVLELADLIFYFLDNCSNIGTIKELVRSTSPQMPILFGSEMLDPTIFTIGGFIKPISKFKKCNIACVLLQVLREVVGLVFRDLDNRLHGTRRRSGSTRPHQAGAGSAAAVTAMVAVSAKSRRRWTDVREAEWGRVREVEDYRRINPAQGNSARLMEEVREEVGGFSRDVSLSFIQALRSLLDRSICRQGLLPFLLPVCLPACCLVVPSGSGAVQLVLLLLHCR